MTGWLRAAGGLVAGLLLAVAAWGQTGTAVNPPVGSVWTWLGPTFGASWVMPVTGGGWGIDVRQYGAICGADSTAALQSAVNTATQTGGTIVVGCPITVTSTVSIPPQVRLTGGGSMFPKGQSTYPVAAPSTALGGAIICATPGAATASPCLLVNGSGVEIDHIAFSNPLPTPAMSGIYAPPMYPFVIGTSSTVAWQGLHLHDLSFTSTMNAIWLEGTPNYTVWAGQATRIEHIWCNPCLNTGLRVHNYDNALLVNNWDTVLNWNIAAAPLGAYLREHAVGFDIQYAAAPQFSNVNFYAIKTGIQLTNGNVTNNFGSLVFAISAGQFTNMMFNNTCQAMTLPNGNGTVVAGGIKMVNVDVWGDQTGFQCSKGKALFDMPANGINVSISHLNVYDADTVFNFGCGTPGVGACPSGGPGSYSVLRLEDAHTVYSEWTPGSHFIRTPVATVFSLGSLKEEFVGVGGPGTLIGPGMDGTQGYEAVICIGGTPYGSEGSACLQGSHDTATTGSAIFHTLDGTRRGYIGAGNASGINIKADGGSVFIGQHAGPQMSVGGSPGVLVINVNGLPVSCAGHALGTLWVDAGTIKACP